MKKYQIHAFIEPYLKKGIKLCAKHNTTKIEPVYEADVMRAALYEFLLKKGYVKKQKDKR